MIEPAWWDKISRIFLDERVGDEDGVYADHVDNIEFLQLHVIDFDSSGSFQCVYSPIAGVSCFGGILERLDHVTL